MIFFLQVPTYRPDGHDQETRVDVHVRCDRGGVELSLLSGRDQNNQLDETLSPNIYVERQENRWLIAIQRFSGGDGTLHVTIPDEDGEHGRPKAPLVAEEQDPLDPVTFVEA